MSFLQKSALFKDKNLLKGTFYIVKKKKSTKILKSRFLENGFFQSQFLKSNNSVTFLATELGELSFDSEFIIDFHTDHNYKTL